MHPAEDDALYAWNVTEFFGPEYVPVVQDVIRMVCIQITIQLLLWINDPAVTSFFTTEFLTMVIYIVLGVLLYWLVFKKMFSIQ